jgi:hypothetical protein
MLGVRGTIPLARLLLRLQHLLPLPLPRVLLCLPIGHPLAATTTTIMVMAEAC